MKVNKIYILIKLIRIKPFIYRQLRRATLVALLFFSNPNLSAESFNVRALWVVRDYIITKVQIDNMLKFAMENNYNHIFVQIRGRGDAYYDSKLVSRTHLLKGNSFDPLKYILNKTKGSSLKIHAWINVYYVWSSPQKPINNNHVLLNHPDWLDNNIPDQMNVKVMLDKMRKDRKINGEGFYLAPTHPEVDAHLQNIITEILQNYRLDGIHFDYIRYHNTGWGMNPTGLKFFLNHSNSMPGLPSLSIQDKPSFSEFKRQAITNFIKNASTRIRAYQPDCIVSAAVKPNINNAKNNFGQEWDFWLKNSYIDWAVPMNYSGKSSIFEKNIEIIISNIPKRYINRIIMGIGAYNQDSNSAGKKIATTGKYDFGGISIFSYTVFDKNPNYANQIFNYLR